jgi:biotin-(acetyl-CoA carboxylase) ligase
VSTPYEMFRATLPTFTPDGEQATIIITRQGQGSAGRVWITFSGAWVTTAVMSDEQAERLERLSVMQDGRVGEHTDQWSDQCLGFA